MIKRYTTGALLFFTMMTFQMMTAQTLVHYWNFNNNTTIAALTTPTSSLVPGAALNALPGGTSAIDAAGGTGQNFGTLNLNARNGDPSGSHLRFNNPIGGTLEFALPTTGYINPIVKFATRRSGSGAGTQQWAYSLNGTTYTNFVSITVLDADPVLQTLDFSAIDGADNNPNFKLRVTFSQGAGGTAGNNRFDNFTLDATASGGDVNAPVATILPLNGSTNVALTATPTITFNEAVRLVAGNATLTNANAGSVVELRLGNAAGPIVPFDAFVDGNMINMVPQAALLNNQQYYVALLPNTIEDLNDNAITTAQSSTFTTLYPQPNFTAGDIAIVGYRMSATGAEDEIAFVSLKTMLPGTVLTFTDSKYTSNSQEQCDGGIEWTSPTNQCLPAGTVITIETSTLVANLGTTSGNSFGLSSTGDQIIVYTGSAGAPTYMTALSSNGWVATTTSCGGSESMIPAALTNGVNALNAATAPGNTAGNAVNAYYNGPTTGTISQIRTNIMNPANWVASAASTPAQTWPAWSFPTTIQVNNVAVPNNTTIVITFSGAVDPASGSNTSAYTGIDGLTSAVVSGNTVTLTYGTPFQNQNYELQIGNITGANGIDTVCFFGYTFDGSLSVIDVENGQRFLMTPNPANGAVFFNRTADVEVFDLTGKKVLSAKEALSIDVSDLMPGLYVVRHAEGFAQKLMVK